MSGGVDSSVAAWLLCEAGHEVIGMFMRHGGEQGDRKQPSAAASDASALPRKQGCCSAVDAADARRVAEQLGIAFFVLDFQPQFKRIVDYFLREYARGRTPNPCIVCNTWLKFGKLHEYAEATGAEYIATGHYARLAITTNGTPALYRGIDRAKDQSYVLFGIPRALLPRLMFPLGEYRKEEVRRLAQRMGLRVADKPDSQEICFIPDQDHSRFFRAAWPDADTAGEIVTTTGQVVGRHDGIERFTIGQRKGLGVALGRRWYVVRIEAETRRVVIGERQALARKDLFAAEANWLAEVPPEPFRCQAQIRYRATAEEATVTLLPEGRFRVVFASPVFGVAPGQAVVCYDGQRLLGGGWIE
jgi:tRNA-specific 2-thiouridylase